MRAWLLLLAVLATFQTIVQVASTEDNNISSAFIRAIQPIKTDLNKTTTSITTTALIQKPPPVTTTDQEDFPNGKSENTTEEKEFYKIVYKTYKTNQFKNTKNNSDKNTSEKVQNIQTIRASKFDKKNIKEIEQNKNNLENEVIEKQPTNLNNNKQNKKLNKTNKNINNKMALKENQMEQHKQQTENQKSTQQIEMHREEDTNLNKEKSSSSNNHQHHKRHQQQQQQQHNHQSKPQHQHNQYKSQPASQQNISDNLTTTTTSSSSTSSSSKTSNGSSSTTSQTSLAQAPTDIQEVEEEEEDDAFMSSSTFMENDDGAISVESQQPQLDAVIPDEGPRTYSNQEIIADKVKPDPSTLVEIESSLLTLFNMKRPPKIDRSKIVIPEPMRQLYEQITGQDLDSVNIPKPGLLTKSANTVRSFAHQSSKIDDRFPHHHRFRLYFDINSIPAREKLKAAELQLTRDAISRDILHPRAAKRTRYQVVIYDIAALGVKGKYEPHYLLLDNKTIRLNSTDRISLDVKPAIDRWMATPKKNFGLLVEVRTSESLKPAPHHHVRLRRSADEEHEQWQHKQPILYTYTDDEHHKLRSIRDVSSRSKQAGGHHRRTHRRKNNEEICRRHSLYVDFEDVGWSDWIVAPPGYDAFYCHGRCPFPIAEHLNSTNHAVVQTLVNSINPGKVPKACCVPTQLEGISMLYLNDQSTVVLKNYQDMTVVGCGCR